MLIETMHTIIAPRWLLTMTEPVHVQEHQAVLVERDRILKIASREELCAQYPDAKLIERPEHLLMPGLINLHTHAAMNLLRGVGDDLPLSAWLQTRIWPLEAALVDSDFVFDGTVLAAAESLLGGVTTLNDMYFYPGDAARAAQSMGIRMVCGITVIEFPTRYANDAADYLERGLTARDDWRGEACIHWSIAPHAPYTVRDDSFKTLRTLAEQLDLPVHMHVHETQQEISDSIAQYGMRPLERLTKLDLVNERLLLVHGVYLTTQELEQLQQHGAHWAHCPSSNLKLASGIAPVAEGLALGVNLGFGTDGAASNNRLDLWEEARLGALLAKGRGHDATALPAVEVLRGLTTKAARALGLEHQIGQISEGFQADLITVKISNHPWTQPAPDLLSHLVYVNQRHHVEDTMVSGRFVVISQQLQDNSRNLLLETLLRAQTLWQTRVTRALQGL